MVTTSSFSTNYLLYCANKSDRQIAIKRNLNLNPNNTLIAMYFNNTGMYW